MARDNEIKKKDFYGIWHFKTELKFLPPYFLSLQLIPPWRKPINLDQHPGPPDEAADRPPPVAFLISVTQSVT